MKAGKTYKIVCTCEDGKVYVSIDEDSPVNPFRLEGAFIRGLNAADWSIKGDGAIYAPDIDAATGYATYQVQVNDLKGLDFKIGGPTDWEYNWGFPADDTPKLKDGGDFVKLTDDNAKDIKLLDAGEGSFATGEAAMITILTKPAYEDKSNPEKSIDRDGDEVITYPIVPAEVWIKAEKLVVTKVTQIVLKTPPEIGNAGYIAFCEAWLPNNKWDNTTTNKVSSLKDGMAMLTLSDCPITLSQKTSLTIQILNPPSDADFWNDGGKIGGGAIASETITADDMANFVAYSKTADFATGGVWLTVFKNGDGNWTARIEQPEQNLYFDNTTAGLSEVNVHYWGDGATKWPGVPCTQLSGANTAIWKAYVPACAKGVIFNGKKSDGSAWQTGNIENDAIKAGHKYTGVANTGKAPTDGGEFSE